MLLQSVKVIDNTSGDTLLELPLEDQFPNLFYVQNIDGLDPVDATLISSKFARLDGEQYAGGQRVIRNIIFTLGLNPDYGHMDAKTLRDQLYRYFMPKSPIRLRFHMFDQFTDDVLVQELDLDATGVIESFVAPLFVSNPTATITVVGYDPDFIDQAQKESFGLITTDSDHMALSLDYAGSVPTGAIFELEFENDTTVIQLELVNVDGSTELMQFNYDFLTGDILTFNTTPGSKTVNLLHAGVNYPIMFALQNYPAELTWITLKPGRNVFLSHMASDGVSQTFNVKYYNRYGGL